MMDIELETNKLQNITAANSYISCSLHEPVKLRNLDNDPLAETNIQTIPEFFHKNCQKYKDLPALAYETPAGNNWSTVTYADYEKNVEQAALVLLHLGVRPHTSIGILAFNCPEWFYVELGALRIGAIVAGIYITNSSEAVYHALEVSDATVCLVDDAQQMLKVRAIKSRLKQLRAVVQLNGPYDEFVGKEPGCYRWKDLFEMQFSSTLREELNARESKVMANECALIIFTSGTVGLPKGVLLSHASILACSNAFTKLLPTLQDTQQSGVSYLPLNHIAAQFFDVFMAIENGFLIHFADRNALKGSLAKTCAKARVTMLFGVPRVYEKMQEKLLQFESESSSLKQFLLKSAREVMESYHLDKMENKATSSLKYWLASKVVNKIKAIMGLDHLRWCMVGGAVVTEETKKFFLSLDVPLIDVFGMSETSGPVIFNFERPNLKTVGKPIEDLKIKIDSPNESGQGEVLMQGPYNLMGYLKDFEKTAETITEDGYLRTGDMGYLDEQGNLYLNGRKKELIITAGGENIPPVYIEEIIKKELPCLSNVMVIGDQRKYLTVLLTLKTDIDPDSGYPLDTLRPEALQWLSTIGVHYTHVSDLLNIKLPENLEEYDVNTVELNCDAKVWQALKEGIKRYNKQAISNVHKVQYFTLLPHDFTVPTNELGPTLKVKRNAVQQKYAKIIDKMYQK